MRIIAKKQCSSHLNDSTYIISVGTRLEYRLLTQILAWQMLQIIADWLLWKILGKRYQIWLAIRQRNESHPISCYHKPRIHIHSIKPIDKPIAYWFFIPVWMPRIPTSLEAYDVPCNTDTHQHGSQRLPCYTALADRSRQKPMRSRRHRKKPMHFDIAHPIFGDIRLTNSIKNLCKIAWLLQ